jgi:predicted transcriptional regulator YdeE
MNLTEQNFKELELYGIRVRTSNSNQRIFGKMWGEFFAKGLNHSLGEENPTYAVYFNYESDEKGEFDFFIGKEKKVDGLEKISIPHNTYFKKEFIDQKPEEVVTDFWMQVWKDDSVKSNRAYQFDFEKYEKNTIEIFLSKK